MNRRLFLLLGSATCLAAASAGAAHRPQAKGTVTVKVLSVDREQVVRHDFRRESFKTGERSSGWDETTTFVARAQIETVLQSDIDLSPGAVIELRYFRSRRSEQADRPAAHNELRAGETRTLTLFRGETSFWWRGS